jgi:hypothetical protein
MDRSESFYLFLFIRTDDDLDNYKTTSRHRLLSQYGDWLNGSFFHKDKGRVNIKSFYHNKRLFFTTIIIFFCEVRMRCTKITINYLEKNDLEQIIYN